MFISYDTRTMGSYWLTQSSSARRQPSRDNVGHVDKVVAAAADAAAADTAADVVAAADANAE